MISRTKIRSHLENLGCPADIRRSLCMCTHQRAVYTPTRHSTTSTKFEIATRLCPAKSYRTYKELGAVRRRTFSSLHKDARSRRWVWPVPYYILCRLCGVLGNKLFSFEVCGYSRMHCHSSIDMKHRRALSLNRILDTIYQSTIIFHDE